jgi:serine protease Do
MAPRVAVSCGGLFCAAAVVVACLCGARASAEPARPDRPRTRPSRPEPPKPNPAPARPPLSRGELRRRQRWERFWSRPQTASKYHDSVKRAFAPLVAAARKSTVGIYCNGQQVALGTVVDPDGYVVTKASELDGPAECRFHDGARRNARLVGASEKNDLALLKVDAAGLSPIQWSGNDDPAVGSWVVTPALGDVPVSIGVVSVRSRRPEASRRPAPNRGFLGISLQMDTESARIEQVHPNTGAARASLRRGDVITAVNTTAIRTREQLLGRLRSAKPGEKVELKVTRGDKELAITATLGHWLSGRMLNPQEHMGGPLSEQSAGFGRILQHDSALKPTQCGGPAVDSSGKAVGINIARAGRVETYALPASLVKSVVAELKAQPTSAKAGPKPPGAPASRPFDGGKGGR